MCTQLSPVVEPTLHREDSLPDPRNVYGVQPLVACLEQAGKENFMIKEAIPLIQLAIILIGDAA